MLGTESISIWYIQQGNQQSLGQAYATLDALTKRESGIVQCHWYKDKADNLQGNGLDILSYCSKTWSIGPTEAQELETTQMMY